MKHIPQDLIEAVTSLTFENPSDEKWSHILIDTFKTNASVSVIGWLAALVKRKGVNFNAKMHLNMGPPTKWPLE